jgi:hypothetical protein
MLYRVNSASMNQPITKVINSSILENKVIFSVYFS